MSGEIEEENDVDWYRVTLVANTTYQIDMRGKHSGEWMLVDGVPEGGEVATLGFDGVNAQFIQRAIAAVGNYGEIYAREIGDNIPRACTLNDLVLNNDNCPKGQGGIQYALPYR